MGFIQDLGTIIIVIAIVILAFWLSWYGSTKECSKNTENINKGILNIANNFVKHHERIYEQNETIIKNQEKIIELLSKNNKD